MIQAPRALEIKKLSITLGEHALIDALDLRIEAGETVALMGSSGSGKSTLLSWLCGMLDSAFHSSGELWLDEQRIDQHPCEQRKVGLLFQDALLFPHLSVGENLVYGVPAKIAKTERFERAQEALEQAGLHGFFHHDPATLSGGQRARISLMRTLLAEPKALLLDEPYSRLDQELKAQFRAFVLEHVNNKNLPVLMVTHDPDDVPVNSRCLSMRDLASTPTRGN